jgi:hypothetical protein
MGNRPTRAAFAIRPTACVNASLRWQTSIALDHAVLHLDGAANGIDDASELNEDPIARPLDDAAVMKSDSRVDQITAKRTQPRKRPLLVGTGETSAARMAASFRVSAMAALSGRS